MGAEAAVVGGSALLGGLGGGGGSTSAQVPGDLRGPRAQQIALLNYLLGLGPQPGQGAPAPQQTAGPNPRNLPPGSSAGGGAPGGGLAPGFPYRTGDPVALGTGPGGFQPDFSGNPTQRLESFFGGLGFPTTGLQQQSVDALGNMLRQPAPEQRALDLSLPALQGILGGNPGQGVIDALQPTFERNLASANQTGARFGSANAVLRSRALDDFNLLAANAAQQGVNQQISASQALGMLAQAAGQNPFERAQGAFGVGSQLAGQNDVETQRRLQILLQLLGTAQSATLGLPVTQNPGFAQNALSGGLTGATIFNALNPASTRT